MDDFEFMREKTRKYLRGAAVFTGVSFAFGIAGGVSLGMKSDIPTVAKYGIPCALALYSALFGMANYPGCAYVAIGADFNNEKNAAEVKKDIEDFQKKFTETKRLEGLIQGAGFSALGIGVGGLAGAIFGTIYTAL